MTFVILFVVFVWCSESLKNHEHLPRCTLVHAVWLQCAATTRCALCKLPAVAILEWAFSQDGLGRLSVPGLRCVSSAQVILRQLYARCPWFASKIPVRSVPAPCTCRAKGGIQPGRVTPALRSRPPVHLHGPVCPALALRTMPPVRPHSPVRLVPALHTHRVRVGIQPGCVVAARAGHREAFILYFG